MSKTDPAASSGALLPDGVPVPRRYWAILAIALGITVSVLDGTIANVALPTIASDLKASPADSIWIVNAYQLAIVVSLLSLSSVGEIWGYRKVYRIGLAVFTCTSLLCALSHTLGWLTFARTLQGFGAAAITSVNTALVRLIYPQKYLARGLGINALVVSVSAAAGPTVAAGVLSVAGWQWLFAVNIPIGAAAFWLSSRFLPANTVKVRHRYFDWKSGLMNAVVFGSVIATIEGVSHEVNWWLIAAGVIAMIVLGYFFIRRERRQTYPLFPVDLLRIPAFSLSIATSVVSFVGQMLAMVSLPFFLQHAMGKDEVLTGLLLTPWPLTTMVFAPLAGVLAERIHPGILGGVGLAIFAFGLFMLGLLSADATHFDIIWRMMVCGCGFGLFQTPNNSMIISSAPPGRSGGASGMLGTARLLGQTTGAALVAMMFTLFPSDGTHASLFLACGFAVIAAVVSLSRVGRTSGLELRQ